MNTNTFFVCLLIVIVTGTAYMAGRTTNPPKDKCEHTPKLPPFSRVDKYSEGLFEAEYEVELLSQDICIVRNVNTDEQWEVKPTEIDHFFMYDNK